MSRNAASIAMSTLLWAIYTTGAIWLSIYVIPPDNLVLGLLLGVMGYFPAIYGYEFGEALHERWSKHETP